MVSGKDETEDLYFIADDDLDGLMVTKKNGEISRVKLIPGRWMPDYRSILNGTEQSLHTYYSDILRAERFGVSPYTYRLLIEFSSEFKEAMKKVTPKMKENLLTKIRTLNIYDIFSLLGKVSDELKNRCELIGLFPLIYIIFNDESLA